MKTLSRMIVFLFLLILTSPLTILAEGLYDMSVYVGGTYYVVPAYSNESEYTYKESCTPADDYNNFVRYPDEHYGKRYSINCMVSSVTPKGQNNDYNMYFCLEDDYFGEFYVIDFRNTDTTKMTEGDLISVYGEFIGFTQEYPIFAMKYGNIYGRASY